MVQLNGVRFDRCLTLTKAIIIKCPCLAFNRPCLSHSEIKYNLNGDSSLFWVEGKVYFILTFWYNLHSLYRPFKRISGCIPMTSTKTSWKWYNLLNKFHILDLLNAFASYRKYRSLRIFRWGLLVTLWLNFVDFVDGLQVIVNFAVFVKFVIFYLPCNPVNKFRKFHG